MTRAGDILSRVNNDVAAIRRAYALALGVVRNPDDALDVVQDAFIKAPKYLDKFEKLEAEKAAAAAAEQTATPAN